VYEQLQAVNEKITRPGNRKPWERPARPSPLLPQPPDHRFLDADVGWLRLQPVRLTTRLSWSPPRSCRRRRFRGRAGRTNCGMRDLKTLLVLSGRCAPPRRAPPSEEDKGHRLACIPGTLRRHRRVGRFAARETRMTTNKARKAAHGEPYSVAARAPRGQTGARNRIGHRRHDAAETRLLLSTRPV
jgi:hypothetical protein